MEMLSSLDALLETAEKWELFLRVLTNRVDADHLLYDRIQ